MIKIYFHLAIASGVVYLILGVILIFLYVTVSKTLVKGIKTVRFNYLKKKQFLFSNFCSVIHKEYNGFRFLSSSFCQ